MKIDISQIYEGWRNDLIPPSKLKKVISQVSKERLALCEECPFHSKNFKTSRPDKHCRLCGCTLRAKTKCLSCECPDGKWTQVLTPEQEMEIEENGSNKINKDSSGGISGNP